MYVGFGRNRLPLLSHCRCIMLHDESAVGFCVDSYTVRNIWLYQQTALTLQPLLCTFCSPIMQDMDDQSVALRRALKATLGAGPAADYTQSDLDALITRGYTSERWLRKATREGLGRTGLQDAKIDELLMTFAGEQALKLQEAASATGQVAVQHQNASVLAGNSNVVLQGVASLLCNCHSVRLICTPTVQAAVSLLLHSNGLQSASQGV